MITRIVMNTAAILVTAVALTTLTLLASAFIIDLLGVKL